MKIDQQAPYVRRGVTQLMYVGDDDAVEKATSPLGDYIGSGILKVAIPIGIGLWLLGGIASKKRKRR